MERFMPQLFAATGVHLSAVAIALLVGLAGSAHAQSVHEAPPGASSTGRLAPQGEPGQPLNVSGVVIGPDGAPVSGCIALRLPDGPRRVYGVKPVSDNQNPRLKLFLRSDAKGTWSFDTIKPGSYPNSRVPPHIHFEVSAAGRATKVFEIVFEGDPFVTAEMRRNPAFSVRPIAGTHGDGTDCREVTCLVGALSCPRPDGGLSPRKQRHHAEC